MYVEHATMILPLLETLGASPAFAHPTLVNPLL